MIWCVDEHQRFSNFKPSTWKDPEKETFKTIKETFGPIKMMSVKEFEEKQTDSKILSYL